LKGSTKGGLLSIFICRSYQFKTAPISNERSKSHEVGDQNNLEII
jgi:hypothetical protein